MVVVTIGASGVSLGLGRQMDADLQITLFDRGCFLGASDDADGRSCETGTDGAGRSMIFPNGAGQVCSAAGTIRDTIGGFDLEVLETGGAKGGVN